MCGILGTINKSFDASVLDVIKHRGPDDFGMETIEVLDNVVQLGQRRLSIIDLSQAGHQPMQTDCGQYMIIYNGEVYNYEELRDRLPCNLAFKGHSDTETLLYYLKEYGIEGVRDFNGIFAFAFLDLEKKKMYLARDPFGVKPLYYAQGEHKDLIFSSELGPIKAILKKREVDLNAMATLLRLRYNPSPYTLDSNIKKIRPGHYFEIDLINGKLESRHVAFLSKIPETRKAKSPQLIEEYGKVMESAVKRQLLSDVEVGILLSGGIDSAVVAALANKHYDGRLKAFTVGFEGAHMEDEIEDAAETAEILGLDHYYRKISFTDFLRMMEDGTRIVEEPLATTSLIPMYFLSELAARHVKVVLTGQGADEPLGGYTRYKSELIREKVPPLIQAVLPSVVRLTKVRNEKVLRGVNALRFKEECDRFLAVYEIFKPEEIQRLIGQGDSESAGLISYFYDTLGCKTKSHGVERMMALDARLNLSDDLLNYTDKITMHFSLECRVPMLDIELVKFIESLPLSSKVDLKGGKRIHKQFAKALLPEKIINRKKKGFQSPTKLWFKKEEEQIKSILLEPETEFAHFFDQSYVAEIIRQHQQGYNREKQIFLLLSIYFWLKNNQ